MAYAAAGGSAIMTADTILAMLQCVRDGELRPDEAMERLANLPYEEAGFAKIDHHRRLRTGLPEVIYAAGKTPAQVGEIFFRMAAMGGDVLATRADEAAFAAVKESSPGGAVSPRGPHCRLAADTAGESSAGFAGRALRRYK